MEENTTSPVPKKIPVVSLMDFYQAVKMIVEGSKVTKEEWNDISYYGILQDTRLKLHKPDGKFYDWIITDGDILGTDYKVIN